MLRLLYQAELLGTQPDLLTSASLFAEPWAKSAKRLRCLVTLPAGETVKKVDPDEPRTRTDPSLYSPFTLPSDISIDLTWVSDTSMGGGQGFPG